MGVGMNTLSKLLIGVIHHTPRSILKTIEPNIDWEQLEKEIKQQREGQ